MDPYEFPPWYPRGVGSFITFGSNHFIGSFIDTTILKFPFVPQEEDVIYSPEGQRFRSSVRDEAVKGLEVEEQIFGILGKHPRIVQLKGKHEDGILLEYLPNGSVERYLQNHAQISMKQRLSWGQQAAEGLAYIHTKNVIQRDVSVGNLLLDQDLSIKLCDFQGILLHPDGTIALDGGSRERTMSSMPHSDHNELDRKNDIFALGTALLIIITGQLPFPDLDIMDEDEINRRFEAHEFPALGEFPGGDVVRNCWMGNYGDATKAMIDLQKLAESAE
jgi:serine/threonine protein kinase